MAPPGDVTGLLLEWNAGDPKALDLLVPLVYAELRQLAAKYLARERAGHTMQPTALVHEAYLKLVDQRRVQWMNRAHFFAISAQTMRRILVDHARARSRAKRAGAAARITLEPSILSIEPRKVDLMALDEALRRLAELDAGQARIVELRYFGGLSIEETAVVVNASAATVKRAWRSARAWLFQQLSAKPAAGLTVA